VLALRAAGHDVLVVAEIARSAEDAEVIRLASEKSRVLLTEDKDFGQLVFAGSAPCAGVVLFRYPVPSRQSVIRAFVELVQDKGDQLRDCFAVVEPGKARFRPRPDSGAILS